MIPKPTAQISITDLNALVGNVRESKTIEFKRELSAKDGDASFLKGVSALANTAGGDFIIGVEASKDGIASAVTGIDVPNLDAEKLRLEQLLASCVEPRLPRIDIHPVACPNGRYVFVVRVPYSWVGPHRITKDNKFYGRNSAGVYALDVGELRTAFALGGTAADRIRAFRTERLGKIIAGETPVPLAGKASVVLHMIPLPSFADRQLFDVVAAIAAGTHFPLPLTGMHGGNQYRVNLDGIVNFVLGDEEGAASYAQLCRNGAIEGVAVINEDKDGLYLMSIQLANMVVAGAKQYLAVQNNLELPFPVFAMLSFCGADGCRMRYTDVSGMGWYQSQPLRGTVIAFPEVALDSSTSDVPRVLRPLLNMVCNGFGLQKSEMYNADGSWKGTA